MKSNISHRIKLARRLRGLSMDMLVCRMGGIVSKMAISKYERGVISPSEHILERMATACGVEVGFFYKQHVDMGKVSFRFYEDQPHEVTSTIMQQVQALLDEYVEAENLADRNLTFHNPLENIAINTFTEVEAVVKKLRHEWQLGIQPIVSVYEMLHLHGVRVLEFYYEDDNVNGLSLYVDGDIPFVLINTFSNKTVERKRFTALHELGHLLLDINIDVEVGNNKPVEKLVNHFAGSMLLPSEVVFSRIGKKRNDITLSELISIKNLYGISVAALNYRLYALDIITYDYRNYIFNEIIRPNRMEEGWGGFPIPETADRLNLMEERIKLSR